MKNGMLVMILALSVIFSVPNAVYAKGGGSGHSGDSGNHSHAPYEGEDGFHHNGSHDDSVEDESEHHHRRGRQRNGDLSEEDGLHHHQDGVDHDLQDDSRLEDR